MEMNVLRIFQEEVKRQCQFTLMAADDLRKSLANRDLDRLWYSLQALLVAAGNVSKLLWPVKPLIPDRGEQLRVSLQVIDDSPLEPRDFRNHFEHFDERLESWATSSQRHNFVDSNIGPPSSIQGIDVSDFLRNFDPETYSLHFRGDVYYLKPVIQAISSIFKVATVQTSRSRSL